MYEQATEKQYYDDDTPERATAVTQALHAIEALDNIIETIEQRLAPALMFAPDDHNDKTMAMVAPVQSEVRSIADRIESRVARLADLNCRIDL